MPLFQYRGFIIAGSAVFAVTACGPSEESRRAATRESAAAAAVVAAAPVASDTIEAGGEVAGDVVPPVAGVWITDANVLALLSLMASRQMAAADLELQAWHSDVVRTFAAAAWREYAALQHEVDSVAAITRLAPVMPALGEEVRARMQAQVDSLAAVRGAVRGAALERAFARQQIAGGRMMADYLAQLAAVAIQPDVQGLMTAARARVAAQLSRARSLEAVLAAADSAAADSAAKAEARRKRKDGAR